MREVVHRIDVPFTTRTVMRVRGDDAVHDRVAEMHVRVCHVDLRAQHHLTLFNLTALHRFEQTQVLLNRTVAVRRSHTGFGRRTFLLCDLFCGLLIDIGFACLDETDRQVVQLLEIIRSIVYLTPLEAQPSDIALDGLYVFGVFFGRVGVVETQVTNAVVFLSNTEVQADCLDVTDMQVAVRLRRETRLNTSVVHSFC